jgi:hypothetical protein
MNIKGLIVLVVCSFLSVSAFSRDDYNHYSIESAMNLEQAKEKLNKGYSYKFGSQSHAPIAKNHGNFMSNKKTNAVGKSDEFACQWAFLSAMMSFQDRISREGGNAVINIKSYYVVTAR